MVRRIALYVCLAGVPAMVMGCKSASHAESNAASAPGTVDGLNPDRPRDTVDLYLDNMRIEIYRGKTDLINEVMNLSEDENDTFWEIYREYEDEYFAIGDRRIALLQEFVDRRNAGTLDNAAASRIGTGLLDERDQMTALLRKYFDRISAELSPIRAAQFLQIEHRSNTVIDLVVASQIPLLKMN